MVCCFLVQQSGTISSGRNIVFVRFNSFTSSAITRKYLSNRFYMKKNVTLSLLFAICIIGAYPPFKTGFLAYIAFFTFFSTDAGQIGT